MKKLHLTESECDSHVLEHSFRPLNAAGDIAAQCPAQCPYPNPAPDTFNHTPPQRKSLGLSGLERVMFTESHGREGCQRRA
jgi:hypothetical protein